MFIDFDYRHLVALRRADPGAQLGFLSHSVVPVDLFTALHAATALYSKRAVVEGSAPAHLRALRGRGIESGVWTIDSEAEAPALAAAGVRSVITDLPLDGAALAV